MYGGAHTTIASARPLSPAILPIAEADADGARGVNHVAVRVYQLDGSDRIGDIAAFNVGVHQADHAAEVARGDQVDGRHAKARAEDAVEWRRRAAALDMPKHGHAHFALGDVADSIPDQI